MLNIILIKIIQTIVICTRLTVLNEAALWGPDNAVETVECHVEYE